MSLAGYAAIQILFDSVAKALACVWEMSVAPSRKGEAERLARGAGLGFVSRHQLSESTRMGVDELGRVYDKTIDNAPEFSSALAVQLNLFGRYQAGGSGRRGASLRRQIQVIGAQRRIGMVLGHDGHSILQGEPREVEGEFDSSGGLRESHCGIN